MLNTVLGSFSSGVAASTSSYESIATATPSGVSTITFSSIPSTYKHLQIRVMISSTATAGSTLYYQFNSDTGSNYAFHTFVGRGTAIYQSNGTSTTQGRIAGVYYGTGGTYPTVAITDIVDYASTSKYKTVRNFAGIEINGTNSEVDLISGLWMNTNAITSMTIFNDYNYNSNTTIALYGIKG